MAKDKMNRGFYFPKGQAFYEYRKTEVGDSRSIAQIEEEIGGSSSQIIRRSRTGSRRRLIQPPLLHSLPLPRLLFPVCPLPRFLL
ncbi:MAG: hypothetical protein ACLTSZ_13265 [Lachnospiraceae bacterium]